MTTSAGLVCWKCGGSLAAEKLPLRREARCAGCGADLHCCRLCVHFEPRWTRGCRETRAEDPRARDVANFCDWFKLKPGAHADAALPADAKKADAKDALAELFKK
jgi:hypothetical protein